MLVKLIDDAGTNHYVAPEAVSQVLVGLTGITVVAMKCGDRFTVSGCVDRVAQIIDPHTEGGEHPHPPSDRSSERAEAGS